jgi:pimeloyl-ACP methyl ester carboxylesterase
MKLYYTIAALWSLLSVPLAAQTPNAVEVEDVKVDVGGYRLQFHVVAGQSPAIVFEAGGGDNSSVWKDIVPVAAGKTGARIITYDRAGLGQSEPDPRPYSITGEVEALERGLKQLRVDTGVILVGHSYGGFLTTLFASRNPSDVKGLVLVDPNLAPYFTDAVIERMQRQRAAGPPQVNPQLPPDPGRVAVGERVGPAFPETVRIMRGVTLPANLRITDIVAERPPAQPPDDAAWLRAHQEFDKAAPNRRGVIAAGSGHYVMLRRPELVIDEITAMFQAVR